MVEPRRGVLDLLAITPRKIPQVCYNIRHLSLQWSYINIVDKVLHARILAI